jgi:RimJ/RimL family protein N-acetyltransferase
MIELSAPNDYAKIKFLFTGPYLTLVIDGVMAGNSTGMLWVDNPLQPQTALMWDGAYIFYLVGQADNTAVNQQLGELFTTQLMAAARKRGIDGFKILYSSPAWESQMAVIFPTLTLTQYPRVAYTLGEVALPDWQSRLPPDYTMRPIDRAMLNDSSLGNHADLIEEIEECWPSQERFLTHGFGFCLVGNQEILCRCTAEYVSTGKCGIGIATAENHRKQGIATLTASAFLDYCQKGQITPYWDAWLRNTASVATAEKIGLRKIQDYSVYVGRLG